MPVAMAAILPSSRVSHAMRFSVAVPISATALAAAGSTVDSWSVVTRSEARQLQKSSRNTCSRQATQSFAQAAGKSDTTKNQRENPFGVKPVVDKVAEETTDEHGSDDCERKLHRQSSIGGIFLHLLRFRRNGFLFGLLIQ